MNRQIDLLEDKAIKNPYLRHSIDTSKQLIYDNDIKTWLYDILQSIKEINGYYDSRLKIFEEYIID